MIKKSVKSERGNDWLSSAAEALVLMTREGE